jgi:hypothetical protein
MTIGVTELPPEGMQLGGVALAGDSARGTRTTEGLSLLFTTAGITVQGPQPQIERLLVWSGLDSATCNEKIVLPDGRNAAVMELTSGGQSIRFLLPSDTVSPGQAAYLDQALPSWLTRYRSAEEATLGLPDRASGLGERPPVGAPSRRPAPAGASVAAGAAVTTAATTSGASGPSPAGRPPASGGFNGTTGTPAAASAARAPTAPPPPAPPPAPSAGPPPPVPPPVPPPPPTPGTVTWVLSVDPMPPGTEWDNPPIGEDLAEEAPAPPVRKRWGRRKAKAAAGVAAGTTAIAAATTMPTEAAAAPPSASAAPPPPLTSTAPPPGPAATTAPPPPPPMTSSPATETPAAAAADTIESAPAPGSGAGDGAPSAADGATDASATTWAGADEGEADRPRRNSRLVVLGMALAVVIAAIAFLVVNRSSSSQNATSPSVAPSPPTPPAPPSDGPLVASINLRLTDLPAGWAQAAPTAPPLHLPVASVAVEAQAARTMSTCLGLPVTTINGLFAGGSLAGQTAVGVSPTFAQTADAGIQMHSTTTAFRTAAQAQAAAAPFANPDFLACYGQFQRTVAAAAVPGGVASVQAVTLPPPTGVKSYGYVTTITSSQGTQMYGQAFLSGGRLLTDLMPATNGPQIPSSDFSSAYDAVGARMSASLQR